MQFNSDVNHRQSIRLHGYNYATSGAYSVTVVTQGRECAFGDVVDGVMTENTVGRMVRQAWFALPDRFPRMSLDAFVVMPNHIHGIIWIEPHGVGAPLAGAQAGETGVLAGAGATANAGAPASTWVGARPTPTLGDAIGAFKSITTVSNIRTSDMFRSGKLWQRNYWERVIRDDGELNRIRRYIMDNPANWETDEERPRH